MLGDLFESIVEGCPTAVRPGCAPRPRPLRGRRDSRRKPTRP